MFFGFTNFLGIGLQTTSLGHKTQHTLHVPMLVYHEEFPMTKITSFLLDIAHPCSSMNLVNFNYISIFGIGFAKAFKMFLDTFWHQKILESL